MSDRVRAPVNRQITIAPASPSGMLPSAHPVNAMDPAANPCHSPTAPSAATSTRLIQASRRAQRAARCQPASCTTGAACTWSWSWATPQAASTNSARLAGLTISTQRWYPQSAPDRPWRGLGIGLSGHYLQI
ncbi:hypothetical protein C1Y40_05548 [Mycobacterium talmoniae]|uniref:Uncharacterized protein n=1 Tax=Mycobacterium talmoniae TaxID=1858794 RepID=A0A2S8BCC1_9MYCO|nr:hypothetical protein C1Y40_05548 [Mycobacterium talmoniae]